MAVVSYKDTVARMLRTPMQKTFTMLGFTLMVVIVFVMGAIRPTLKTISSLRREISERESANEILQEKIDTMAELQKKYEEMSDDLEVIELYFPSDMDYSLVMASLESVTNHYGFTMNSLKIAGEDGRSREFRQMSTVDISLNLTGRISNLTKLLKHLEGMPIVPSLSRVSYSPSYDDDDPEVKVSIAMSAFRTL